MDEQKVTKCDSSRSEVPLTLARLLFENPSATDSELGAKLGLTRQTVNRLRRSPKVQSLVREAIRLPADEIRRVVRRAFAKLEALLEAPDPRIQLMAATQLAKLMETALQKTLEGAVENTEGVRIYKVEWGSAQE